jgi:hypothetical protein
MIHIHVFRELDITVMPIFLPCIFQAKVPEKVTKLVAPPNESVFYAKSNECIRPGVEIKRFVALPKIPPSSSLVTFNSPVPAVYIYQVFRH